jgi:uncharacterized protein YjiK
MVKTAAYIFFYASAALLLLQSCSNGSPYNPDDMPDNNSEYTVYSTGVPELSGICFTAGNLSLMAVSDRGTICEITLEGATIRRLPYSAGADFEGITMNRATGEIFIADEANMTVYKLSASETSLTEVVKINIPDGVYNKGIEGVAYHNGILYIVNQEAPARLFTCVISTQTTSYTDITFAQFLSDICYDDSDNTLWIADSKSKKVFHCNLNGKVIASQAVDYIAKAEALAVDRNKGYMWIGCDSSGKLYKVKIKI